MIKTTQIQLPMLYKNRTIVNRTIVNRPNRKYFFYNATVLFNYTIVCIYFRVKHIIEHAKKI